MDGVERSSVGLVPTHALLRDDAKTGFLEFRDNLAGDVTGGRIGFDNGKRALKGHGFAFSKVG